MSSGTTSTPITRYLALDIHRDYLTVGAVDSQQQIVLTPRRFGFESFAVWAVTHVSRSDAVVLEATANAWVLYDQLTPLAGSVTVTHPLAVKLITAARVKTDARDTIKLARLLAANLIPAVWVPPVAVREVRAGGPSQTARQTAEPGSQSFARRPPAPQSERSRRQSLCTQGARLVALAPAFSGRAAARPAGSGAVRNAGSLDCRSGGSGGAVEYAGAVEHAGPVPAAIAWAGHALCYDRAFPPLAILLGFLRRSIW